jgi:hypothetical protein
MDRRSFLGAVLGGLLAAPLRAWGAPSVRRSTYGVDAGLLWDTIGLHLSGTIEESVDRGEGRYRITASGEGSRIANQLDSSGILRDGRWAPLQVQAAFEVVGRRSRTEIRYDYGRRAIEYHFRGETFFLRRQRIVDDVLAIPEGQHVDDVFSAMLNHTDGRWPREPDGRLRTLVVRRQRSETEGVDDTQSSYRAELIPAVLRLETDRETGRPAALFDLAPFSSWAKAGRPARIVFGPDHRPQLISASLILGTSLTIRIASAA